MGYERFDLDCQNPISDLLKAAALALRRGFLRRYRCAIASLTLSPIRNLIAVHQQLGIQPEAAKESYANERASPPVTVKASVLSAAVLLVSISVTDEPAQLGHQLKEFAACRIEESQTTVPR